MSEVLRAFLLLALAGAAVTAFAAFAVWQLNEERRIRRALTRVLGAPPEAMLAAHGQGRGAGFSFETAALAVTWDAGAWCLVYGLDEVVGAELVVDHAVVGRVHRGEPRRAVDRIAPDAEAVSLRLIFDDPRHPDFEIALWPQPSGRRGGAAGPRETVAEANRWLARVEALLRRPGGGAAVVRPEAPPAAAREPEPPPWEDDEDFEDEAEEDQRRLL